MDTPVIPGPYFLPSHKDPNKSWLPRMVQYNLMANLTPLSSLNDTPLKLKKAGFINLLAKFAELSTKARLIVWDPRKHMTEHLRIYTVTSVSY